MEYDGLGRRIVKAVANSADWDCTWQYYHDGQRMIETRNGSGETLQQYTWGLTYIDELVQVGVNDDPADPNESVCETFYAVFHDANFNVLGLKNSNGTLVERYHYRPYGQRTVYFSLDSSGNTPGDDDLLLMSPTQDSRPVKVSGVAQPYGLCDFGHQGLLEDRQFGWLDSRARPRNPRGPWPVRDHWMQYLDGMNLYHPLLSNPTSRLDPSGMWNENVHFDLTLELANRAKIACAETIAVHCRDVDTDPNRRPGRSGVMDIAWRKALEKLFKDDPAAAAWKVKQIALWHFPFDLDGWVRPDSEAAKRKYKAAIGPPDKRVCNLKDFAEGLHVYQDSWSHQGLPYLGLSEGKLSTGPGTFFRIGHYRAAFWVGNHYEVFYGGEIPAFTGSADDVNLWPKDARDAGYNTYRAMLEFKKACPCACPGRRITRYTSFNDGYSWWVDRSPTSSGVAQKDWEVMYWLYFEKYPGDNVQQGETMRR